MSPTETIIRATASAWRGEALPPPEAPEFDALLDALDADLSPRDLILLGHLTKLALLNWATAHMAAQREVCLAQIAIDNGEKPVHRIDH